MHFNPNTKEIFTDNGNLIKQLNCPYKMNWEDLITIDNLPFVRQCSNCDHRIIDTAYYNDTELLELVQKNTDTCLRVDLQQKNIKLISNAMVEKK